jgi:hypothetical protein
VLDGGAEEAAAELPEEATQVGAVGLDRLADELVAMAGAMIRRLNLARRDPDVVLAGGIFDARDDDFDARIAAGVHTVAPNARLRRSDAPPVLGAALLGLDRLGCIGSSGDRAAEARLRAALRSWQPASR